MINVRGLCKKFDDFEALNNLEFVGSVVGDSVLMGGSGRNTTQIRPPKQGVVPIAKTDFDDGESEDEGYGGEKWGRPLCRSGTRCLPVLTDEDDGR